MSATSIVASNRVARGMMSRSAFMRTTIFLVLGCCGACAPVVTLEVRDFEKIPLRTAVIVPKTDAHWAASGSIQEGPAQLLFTGEQKWEISSPSSTSSLESRSLHPLPLQLGGTTYKIETPLKCYDSAPRTPRIRPGERLEPIYEPHFELLVSYLRTQVEGTLRKNLPLFLSDPQFMEAVPSDSAGYDLIVLVEIRRWPTRADPPNRVDVNYAFTFRNPSGDILLRVSSTGSAKVTGPDPRTLLPCGSSAWEDLQGTYMMALAAAHARAVGSLFSQIDVVNALRSYAATKGER